MRYIRTVYTLLSMPFLLNKCEKEKLQHLSCRQFDYASTKEFIDFGKNKGLTHIVADNDENKPQFLNTIFKNEEKFPYLTKIYDSSEQSSGYHLKIFRIDYEKFGHIEEFN